DLGVNENNIFVSNICTKCNNDMFYSYRVKHTTGRMGIFISL
ncbi:MAG: laccase domain-containing protein, partial [Endomicrobia bacterium]|nr:laccase domain-containing protein [Endomicrobiia bacterium]